MNEVSQSTWIPHWFPIHQGSFESYPNYYSRSAHRKKVHHIALGYLVEAVGRAGGWLIPKGLSLWES